MSFQKFIREDLLKTGFVVLVITVLSGCLGNEETPKPNNLIDEENYIDLLVEMQHIKTFRNAQPDSVNADSLKNLIYIKFGITEEQYLESHRYYQTQVKRQVQRVSEAIRRLEGEEQYIQSHIDSVKAVVRKDTLE